MFASEEYRQRRERLVHKLGNGIIILPSYSNKTMSNDVHYEFRQQSDFLYFTGFPEPDSVAIIEINDDTTKYTLFVPKRDKDFEIWNGRRYGTEGAKSVFGADEAFENEQFETMISDYLIKYENLYYIFGENEKFDELIQKEMLKATKSRNKVGTGPINITHCKYQIHEIRAVKTQHEIEVMKQSAKISAEAMKLGIQVTKEGLMESQIESVIEYYYAKNGAARVAYPTIAGSGVNATILHYVENSETLKNGDLLLVDAGAEYKGYASDITRTWPINGKFSEPQREVYELVLKVQEECIAMSKPGISIQTIHEKAIELITEGLINLGLLTGEIQENIEKNNYRRFFMHGLGHYLGMDVHDTGSLGRNYTLAENMYFTVEPGIYIPCEDDIPEKYRGIGIRIEDDILITNNGPLNLTSAVPKTIDEIEALVGTIQMP